MGTPYITTPVIHEDALYVGTGDGRIARFDARRGQLLGEFSVAGPVAVGYRLAAEPEGIFGYLASEGSGRGFAARALFLLAPGFDAVRWTRSNTSWTSPRPFSWKNGVVVGDDSGQVVALRSADGAEQWRLQLEGVVRGIGGRDDLLFVGMLDGKLYAYRLND